MHKSKFKLYGTLIVTGILLVGLSVWAKDQLLPIPIRAVYLVDGQGELSQSELAKYPEVVVTGSFEKFQEYAKQRVSLWIDKNALSVVDHSWLKQKPQIYYPIVLVGYGDDNYSFENMLGMSTYYGAPFLGTGRDKLSANRSDPGFSVLQLEKFNPPPDYLSFPGDTRSPIIIFKQGYRYKPHVEDILNITNSLLEGTLKQPTASPTLRPVAIPTVPTPTLPS